MNNTIIDPWNIGYANKNGLWGYYSITNYIGATMCGILWLSIVSSRNKKKTEIYIAGLCFGCITMSTSCATQCIINWISNQNRFEYGTPACTSEAYFHVSSIIYQFINEGLIAASYYNSIWNRINPPVQKKDSMMNTYIICSVSFIVSYLGTCLIGIKSEIILLDAGAYCFFSFTSPVMLLWLDPILVITVLCIIYKYRKIFKLAKESSNNSRTSIRNDKIIKDLVKIESLFIMTLVVGWFSALVASIYALSNDGHISKLMDTFVGVFGSLHSILVPIVYGYHSEKLKKFLARISCVRKLFYPHHHVKRRQDTKRNVLTIVYQKPVVKDLQVRQVQLTGSQNRRIETASLSPPSPQTPNPIKIKVEYKYREDF